MSPNCRERSTSTTLPGCGRLSTSARLVAMIDLPTPPLPETMVIIRPSRRRAPSVAAGPPLSGWRTACAARLRAWKACTRWMAATRSSPANGFWRTSRAPASMARRKSSLPLSMDMRMTPACGAYSASISVAWTPSRPVRPASRMAMSGTRCSASWSACSPSSAVPQTVMSSSAARRRRRLARIRSLPSATRTRITAPPYLRPMLNRRR